MTFKLFGGDTEECRACGEEVSTDADVCPHCGENLRSFKIYSSTVPCRACGEKVSTDAHECPHCGEDLDSFKIFSNTVACRACGELISEDATECPHCGEDLEDFKIFSSTVECRACGEEVSRDATECPHCGEDLEKFKIFSNTVPCRACGRQVSEDADECPHCGEDLDDSFFAGSTSTTSYPSNDPPEPERAGSTYTSSGSSDGDYGGSSSGQSGCATFFVLVAVAVIAYMVIMTIVDHHANNQTTYANQQAIQQPVQQSSVVPNSSTPADTLAAYYANMEVVNPYDTSSIKHNLLGNAIPGVRFTDTTEFSQLSVVNRTQENDRLVCEVNIIFTYSATANLIITYFNNSGHWSLLGIKENNMTYDQVVSDTTWTQTCPIAHTNWTASNQYNLSWRAGDSPDELQSGPALPHVTLPTAPCYYLKSREGQPVTVRFTYVPRDTLVETQ